MSKNSIMIDTHKKVSELTEEEKNAFLDYISVVVDFGFDSLSEEELNLYRKIVSEKEKNAYEEV